MLPDYPFESKYLQLDRQKLHYIDEGSGPPVVLVHGNPTWSYFYRHLIAKLKNDFRVIAVDHIGCGLSDKPLLYDYTLENHIDNLQKLISELNLGSFSLVVHDWGGAIGIGATIGNIEKLKNLVVLNTAAFRSTRIPLRIQLCRIPVLGEIIVRLFNGFAYPATFMAVEKKMVPEVARAYVAPYNNWQNRIATHRFVEDIPLKQNHPSYHKLVEIENHLVRLKQQDIPTQIVWGGKDFCFNDAFLKEWISRFPDAEVHYFKKAGHYILEDEREEANTLIQTFLLGNSL